PALHRGTLSGAAPHSFTVAPLEDEPDKARMRIICLGAPLWSRIIFRDASKPSKLPEQPPEPLHLVIHAAAAQRIPDDRLMCGHDVDAEFLLQHVNGAGGWPVRRGQEHGVG